MAKVQAEKPPRFKFTTRSQEEVNIRGRRMSRSTKKLLAKGRELESTDRKWRRQAEGHAARMKRIRDSHEKVAINREHLATLRQQMSQAIDSRERMTKRMQDRIAKLHREQESGNIVLYAIKDKLYRLAKTRNRLRNLVNQHAYICKFVDSLLGENGEFETLQDMINHHQSLSIRHHEMSGLTMDLQDKLLANQKQLHELRQQRQLSLLLMQRRSNEEYWHLENAKWRTRELEFELMNMVLSSSCGILTLGHIKLAIWEIFKKVARYQRVEMNVQDDFDTQLDQIQWFLVSHYVYYPNLQGIDTLSIPSDADEQTQKAKMRQIREMLHAQSKTVTLESESNLRSQPVKATKVRTMGSSRPKPKSALARRGSRAVSTRKNSHVVITRDDSSEAFSETWSSSQYS